MRVGGLDLVSQVFLSFFFFFFCDVWSSLEVVGGGRGVSDGWFVIS